VIELSLVSSVGPHSTREQWIRMPFGVVSGVRLGMDVLDFVGDRRKGRGSLG